MVQRTARRRDLKPKLYQSEYSVKASERVNDRCTKEEGADGRASVRGESIPCTGAAWRGVIMSGVDWQSRKEGTVLVIIC